MLTWPIFVVVAPRSFLRMGDTSSPLRFGEGLGEGLARKEGPGERLTPQWGGSPRRRPVFCSSARRRGGRQMKITDVQTTLLKTGSIFVQVHTDEGISGIGECSPMNGRVLAHFVDTALKPL